MVPFGPLYWPSFMFAAVAARIAVLMGTLSGLEMLPTFRRVANGTVVMMMITAPSFAQCAQELPAAGGLPLAGVPHVLSPLPSCSFTPSPFLAFFLTTL